MDDSDHRDDQDWLVRDYGPAYRTACLLLDDTAAAEVAVLEAFRRVWRFRDAVPVGDARRPWLYRAVINACLAAVLAEKSPPIDDLGPALEGSAEGRAGVGERTGGAPDVIAALAALPKSLLVPLVLRFWAGLTEQEIAIATDRRPGTVQSRLHEAGQRLSLDPRLSAWAVPTAEVSP